MKKISLTSITRQEAIARGLKRYFTGKPCKRGHICDRYVLRRVCVECHDMWKRPKAYSNQYQKMHRNLNPKKALLASARARAKRKGLPCTLTENDIHIPETCPVFGTTLKMLGGRRTNDTISLDRFDNTKGYTSDNVCVISWRANHHKSDLTLEEMKKLVAYMEHNNG